MRPLWFRGARSRPAPWRQYKERINQQYNPAEIYTWIVDVKKGTLKPFYYDGKAGFFGISPNNTWILYGYEGALWVRNLKTNEDYKALSGDITPTEFWWLKDGNRAVYVDHTNPGSDRVYIYDFQLKKNTALTGEQFRTNVGTIGSSIISQDFNKLAFIDYGFKGLYILTLCLP